MRCQLTEDLTNYAATEEESKFIDPMVDLLKKDDAFFRTFLTPGHFTGSGILLDMTGTQILLNHHKILNRWLCFGGHADGQEDIREVALRETIEESGYGADGIEFVTTDIFDIDIHTIPENKHRDEGQHLHFDIAFLFRLKDSVQNQHKISDESNDLMWCPIGEAYKFVGNDHHMLRMIEKLSKRV